MKKLPKNATAKQRAIEAISFGNDILTFLVFQIIMYFANNINSQE